MSDQPVAIVTGGASGIGLAIASALITEAYDVFVFDSELHHIENYNANHPLARAQFCDVSDALAVASEVEGVLHVTGGLICSLTMLGSQARLHPLKQYPHWSGRKRWTLASLAPLTLHESLPR